MPSETPRETNPFASPIIASDSSTPSVADITPQHPDILATASLLLEQLRDLESLYSAVEERVQRKRETLKELEDLVAASAIANDSPPSSPACPVNTPISLRLRLKSPRLRGLFDLRGPGKANPTALQTSLDYSPETQVSEGLAVRDELGQVEEEWEDDDEDAPLCPFDDKYALQESPLNVDKELPAIPQEQGEILPSKIPRKLHLKRRVSTSKYFAGRSGTATRVPSKRRQPSMRHSSAKSLDATASPKNETTMQRGSWRRGILENVNGKTKGGARTPLPNENDNAKESGRRKEKRKGLWSIYSVYSELGLSGSYHTVSG